MTGDPRAKWNDSEPDDEAASAFFRPRSGVADDTLQCPAPELVQASHMGALPAHLQEPISSHVERCVVCQALGEALDDPSVGSLTPDESARILTRVRAELRPARRRFRRQMWPLSAAAAVLALAASGSVLLWQSRNIQHAPAPPRLSQDVRLPNVPSVFKLEKPSMPAPAPTDLVWRGAGSGEADLARALEPFASDDFAEAARRLRALVERYPQSAAGHFYLGVSELFLARDPDAATALETAQRLAKDSADLAREATWYLAVAYRRTGQIERAAATLDALCRGQNTRAAQACAGLRELSTSSSAPRAR